MRISYYFTAFLFTLLSIVVHGQSNAGNVRMRAEANLSEMRIGDICELIFNISAPAGTVVEALNLDPIHEADNLEIRTSLPRSETANNPELLLREVHQVTSFSPGVVLIPSLAAAYRLPDGRMDTVYSQSLTLQVNDILVQGDEDVAPIKDIYREGFSIWDLWPLLVLTSAGLLALLGFGMWKRSANWRRVKPAEVLAPHLLAYQKLEAIEQAELWQKEQLDPFYTRLSDCLRQYLKGRFGINAPELTTAETEQALSRQVQLTDQQRFELGQLLQASDLVKFADQSLSGADHQSRLDWSRGFVRRTAPKPEITPEEEAS